VLVVAFSDVEAAHFGSYAMHLGGIRTADRLIGELWAEIESNPDYRGQTTLVVMPEFGRDPDGSPTNGFFNHRFNGDSTRDTWMLTLGAAVDRPQIVERPIRHVDICPTFASLLGCPLSDAQGAKIAEFRV
jgi:arylsulfatase A-like enzyme